MTHNARNRPSLASLTTAPPTAIYLRDSEVVIYRRSRSLLYQCRYKLANGTWHRQTTGKASIEHAVTAACDLYDQARYRQRLGLAHQAHSFAQLAHLVLAELRQQIDVGSGKTAYSYQATA
jgi:integrase